MPGSPMGGHDTEQGTAPMSTYSSTEGAARQPAAQSSPGGIQDESTITGATRATDAAWSSATTPRGTSASAPRNGRGHFALVLDATSGTPRCRSAAASTPMPAPTSATGPPGAPSAASRAFRYAASASTYSTDSSWLSPNASANACRGLGRDEPRVRRREHPRVELREAARGGVEVGALALSLRHEQRDTLRV